MSNMLVRADDLGYCEAFNYGLARAVKNRVQLLTYADL